MHPHVDLRLHRNHLLPSTDKGRLRIHAYDGEYELREHHAREFTLCFIFR